jgi:hypothetical protein
MTTTSFEVGAVFKIVDQATGPLERLSREMAAFDKLINNVKKNLLEVGAIKFAGLETSLKALGDQAAAFGKRMDTSLNSAIGRTDAAVVSVDRLAAAWDAVTVAARAASRAAAASSGVPLVAAGGVASGGAARRHQPRFMSYHSSGVGVPGGHVRFGGGNAALAGAASIAYGAYEAAEMEDIVARSMFHLGKNDDATRKVLRDDILQGVGMGFSLHDVGEAVQDQLRLMKGTPSGGLATLPEMLRSAGAEARLKNTSLPESMKSLTGMSHMLKQYSEEEQKKLAPMFSFLSTATPLSLPQIERAAGYAVPLLQSGLEINPADTLLAGVAMQRAGITNTKSGTWLRELAVRAMPGGKHDDGLKRLGLIDDNDKPTWFTNEKPDLNKLIDIAGEHLEKIPLTERARIERETFGAQGSGALSVLADPAVRKQMGELKKDYPHFKEQYDQFWETYKGQSPVQQARETWGQLQAVLISIGQTALPPVVAGLQQLDAALKGIAAVLPKAPAKGSPGDNMAKGIVPGAAAGAAIGTAVGSPGIGTAIGTALGMKAAETYGFWQQLMQDLSGKTKEGSKEGTAKGAKEGARDGAREGVIQGFGGLLNRMGYSGGGVGGGGGGLINASYTTPAGGASPFSGGSSASASSSGTTGSSAGGAAGRLLDHTPVPAGTLAGAASLLRHGGSSADLQHFMASQGYPKSGNWCGEFAASVVHSMGGAPPKGAAVASNWLTWGQHVDPKDVQPGDIAVRKRSRFGGWSVPGRTGSHVGIVNGVHGNSFDLLGGNQGRAIVPHGLDEYEFRRGRHDPNHPTIAAPPPRQYEPTIRTELHVDGQRMASVVTKHQARGFNSPAKGGRMPDFSSARPVAV